MVTSADGIYSNKVSMQCLFPELKFTPFETFSQKIRRNTVYKSTGYFPSLSDISGDAEDY